MTRHGLRSAYEWRLVRHLAGQVCDETGWSRESYSIPTSIRSGAN